MPRQFQFCKAVRVMAVDMLAARLPEFRPVLNDGYDVCPWNGRRSEDKTESYTAHSTLSNRYDLSFFRCTETFFSVFGRNKFGDKCNCGLWAKNYEHLPQKTAADKRKLAEKLAFDASEHIISHGATAVMER